MQDMAAFALLRIAGKLAAMHGQIARARGFDSRSLFGQRGGDQTENESVGGGNMRHFLSAIVREYQAETQATFAKENGAAAAGTAQDGHAVTPACNFVGFLGQTTGSAQHHGGRRPFPEPQDLSPMV